MGILTSFRAVSGELYTEIVDSDEPRFTAFFDYLNGWAEASAAELPASLQIPRMSLDKGWDDVEYLLKAVTEDRYNDYKRYRLDVVSYQKVYAFCWYEDESLIVLRNHFELCQSLFERDWPLMEVKSSSFHPVLRLLTPSALDESLTLLEAEIIKRVNEREIYSELFDSPFTDASAEYTFSHYRNFLKFLMQNLVMPDGNAKKVVIIGLQW